MKRILFAGIMLLLALTMQAQRCAVFKFNAGSGMTEESIELISSIFRTNFNPTGYNVLEHAWVVRTVDRLGFSQTKMEPEQYLRVGRELDASVIVWGQMYCMMQEYVVTIFATKVENNQTLATETATFATTEYRDKMKSLAMSLARKLSSQSGGATSGGSSATTGSTQVAAGFVDLGLPSGTKWKAQNEPCGLIDYDDAVRRFGLKLPSREQFEELKDYCQWTWTGKGMKVTGPNGNYIVLPAEGYRGCNGSVNDVGSYGHYWSATAGGSVYAWTLYFNSGGACMYYNSRCSGQSVRLVQD